jgi:hypothetical protein
LNGCSTYAAASSKPEEYASKLEIKVEYLSIGVGVESLAEGPRNSQGAQPVSVSHSRAQPAGVYKCENLDETRNTDISKTVFNVHQLT